MRTAVAGSWNSLGAASVSGARRLRVMPLPVETGQGPLVAGVDHDGRRHLLIPIPAHVKVRSGLDGPILRLVARPLEDETTYQKYADLSCLHDDFVDLFTGLCMDVCDAVAEVPTNPLKALHAVLDHWKALFREQKVGLGSEQIVGLYGELLVLARLLRHDASAHRLWAGPRGHRHDFDAGTHAIEVKSSSSATERKPRIHGLEQLEVPENGALWLTWFRLRSSTTQGSGQSLVELVDRVLDLCDDVSAVLELLARSGFHRTDKRYDNARFVVAEERWYRVGPGFPGLTRAALVSADIPISVLDVEYTIDLSGDVPPPLRAGELLEVIQRMIQESV
ncbi:PD-(D/E)XK motif protein [Streptomyces sp. NPDC008125]|uniref:PD-(D/E)XK motif protein n=1 Tax=Streptomyces sp. NPDC008125 TaxID=3364811 RepID=UPI0036E8E589